MYWSLVEILQPVLCHGPCKFKSYLPTFLDSGNLLSNIVSYLLVRHPSTLKRLRQEIHSIADNGQGVTRAQINKMPYLKCVLNESKYYSPKSPDSLLTTSAWQQTGYIHKSPSTSAKPQKPLSYLEGQAQTANHQSSFERASVSAFLLTTCTAPRIYMVKMPMNSGPNDGRGRNWRILDSDTCRFMAAQGSALEVSSVLSFSGFPVLINII